MYWWSWVLLVIVAWYGFGVVRNRRNRRIQMTIHLSPGGQATVQMTPANPADEDLSLLALCYASKMRWLVLTEHERVQEVFQGLCKEAVYSWSAPGSDLIDRMPSARRFREGDSPVHSVPGGERYRVALYRTSYRNSRNSAWVVNTLPRPGSAANGTWSFLLLLNTVFALIKPLDRDVLGRAFAVWFDLVFVQSTPDQSLQGLKVLYGASLDSWLRARASSSVEA